MRTSGSPAPSKRSPQQDVAPGAADSESAWWYWLLVLAPVLFNAIMLTPEFATGVPSKNDSALHLLLVHAASDAVRDGSNPFDFWIPQLELGFPQFVYYQHLPHLAVVALHRALLGTLELETAFHLVRYLLLVSFPLTVAWSMRRMGFSRMAAAVGAAAATLFNANARFGVEYNSYIWRGIGLYTQLWGMHLFLLALASLVVTVNEGRGYVRTALLFGATVLSHLVYAYMLGVTSLIVLIVGTPWRAQWRLLAPRASRLLVVSGLALALTAYMIWPFLQTSYAYLSSLPGILTIRPAGNAMLQVVSGRLFDYQRWPVLTALALIGALVATVRRGPERILALGGFGLWLALLTMREWLRSLSGTLPAHSGFVSYRFVGAVELFAILLMGIGGEAIWNAVSRLTVLPPRFRSASAFTVIALVLAPAVIERTHYYEGNRQVIAETRTALSADTDLSAVLTALGAASADTAYHGRVYAGPRRGWGGQLMVGPSLRVFDVVNAHRMASIGNPFQGLALNSGLLYNFRDGDAGLYDAFDVRMVVTPSAAAVPPFFQNVLRNGHYAVWRVPTTGIAQYVEITARRPARTQRELYIGASDWFVSAAPGAHQVTRWDYPSSLTPAVPFTPTPRCADGGRTSEERVTSQRVSFTAECATAGAVVLKISYHPNWHVQVDGVEALTYMVSPSFIGVDVPAGRHRIEARYVPTRSKVPLLVLALIVLTAAVTQRRHLDGPAQWIARRVGVRSIDS
ncbi:MAG: YfhO family protein [Gemmatimonadaceae bacterium]|nr:YfhO family protein [Gemmatimonadaceae bacterium]